MSTLEVHNHTILGPLHCFDPKPPKGYTNFFDSVVIRCKPSPPLPIRLLKTEKYMRCVPRDPKSTHQPGCFM